MRITGSIEEIIYRNEVNGYTVAIVDDNGEMLTCVGKFPIVIEGQNVEMQGNLIKDKKYGEQFKVSDVKVLQPKSLDGIIKYLGSGLIKGVGPVTSMNIVAKFKEDTLDIIEYNPQRLVEVRGISPAKAVQIHEAFDELKKMQLCFCKVMIFQQIWQLKFTIYMVKKLKK